MRLLKHSSLRRAKQLVVGMKPHLLRRGRQFIRKRTPTMRRVRTATTPASRASNASKLGRRRPSQHQELPAELAGRAKASPAARARDHLLGPKAAHKRTRVVRPLRASGDPDGRGRAFLKAAGQRTLRFPLLQVRSPRNPLLAAR